MKKTSTEKVKEMKDNFVDNCKNMAFGGHERKESEFGIPMFESEQESAPEEPKKVTEPTYAEDKLRRLEVKIEDLYKEMKR